MASVSFGLNRGAADQPYNVVLGTQAVTTYDIEVRVDNTKGLTREEIAIALERIKETVLDGARSSTLANV